jgi:acetate---CoA ligase (ADP-forming)
MLNYALAPRSVAVIGASDNPHKVGGRPILFMQRYGFRGAIYPVNPARKTVQGLAAFPHIDAIPETPDLAVVAVAGDEALEAVEACAARGVKVAVVMASGFGETGEEGKRKQDRMAAAAARSGMRLIGPNCQGLANFATGVVANFSTIFHEVEVRDGPVAIISQSGANSQQIFTLVHEKGLGVRHVHATGNEADVTVADLADAIVDDPGVRLVLLYMEAIKQPALLARAAERARKRDLPIVALKAGRTARGQEAAASHTGALASEDRIVDAFFERHAIWRASNPHDLVAAAALYLSGCRPRGRRLVFLSNSGASCVMAADHTDAQGVPLAELGSSAKARLGKVLPGFASITNPIDLTGALLSTPTLLGSVLPIVGDDAQSDLALLALPVAGAGYDLPGFARDLSAFAQRYGHATALAAPQESVRARFAASGVATFARETEAIDALHQLARHAALLRRGAADGNYKSFSIGKTVFLNEAESLAIAALAGVPVVEHRLCRSEAEVRAALDALGPSVAVKACSSELPHKAALGLVALNPADPLAEFRRMRDAVKVRFDGVIVARMAKKGLELALGARMDPLFGPTVLVGAGGVQVELMKDLQLLLPPFSEADVVEKLARLRIAPLLAGYDTAAFARAAVAVGEAMRAGARQIASLDVNPMVLFQTGEGALAVDALVERIIPGSA